MQTYEELRSYDDIDPQSTTLGTILGVWAHPDDEAYLSAGLMASARLAGHRVVVATATRGEHGTDDPDTWPPHRLARLREQELAASLAVVDVHEHHWLGYTDGTLDAVDVRRGSAEVARFIEDVNPDIVVTFGPDGMTGHPDHQAISAWVTRAWHETGRGSRLWYATQTPEFHAEWGSLNSSVGLWSYTGDAPETPSDQLAYAVRCEGHILRQKYLALRAHHSQTGPLVAMVGKDTYRDWWSSEYFVAAS